MLKEEGGRRVLLFRTVFVVEGEAFFDSGEEVEFAFDHDASVVAMGFDEIGVVRDDDHRAVAALFKKFELAALAEAIVADGYNFIDEVTIELNDHGEGKGEAGAHAGGVAFNGLAQVGTKLGELLNKRDFVFGGGVVNATDEAEVVETGEGTLESAAEGKRPGDEHGAGDGAGGGTLGA